MRLRLRLQLTWIRERGGAGDLVAAVAPAAAADIDPRAGGRGRFVGCGCVRLRLRLQLTSIRERRGAGGFNGGCGCVRLRLWL